MKFQEINKQEYKNYLGKVLFKTFFHELGWQEILAKEFNFKFRFFNWQNKLILSLADLGNDKFFSHPFCEYGGPLPLIENIDFQEFKKDLLEQFPKIKMRFHPQILAYFSQISATEKNGRLKTYWLENLQKLSAEQIRNNLRKTTKHTLRKVYEKKDRENIKVGEIEILIGNPDNLSSLKDFYNIYVNNIKNKGNLILPYSCFEYFQKNNSRICLVEVNKEIVGGSIFLYYDKFIHYFINASKSRYRMEVSYLTIQEELDIKSKKDDVFDFGGTAINSSLAIFKRGWGTIEKNILEIGFDNRRGGFQTRPYQRNLWKLLPDFLAIKVSKKLAKRVL